MYSGTTILVQGLYFKEGDNESEYFPVYSQENGEYFKIEDSNSDNVYTYMSLYTPEALYTELYYRNSAGNSYSDYDNHKWGIENINKSYSVKGFDERFSSDDDNIIAEKLNLKLNVSKDREYISNFYNQPKCWIKNIPTLNILLNLYSSDTKIGNTSTKYNADNLPE
jgi:hypothetical protein